MSLTTNTGRPAAADVSPVAAELHDIYAELLGLSSLRPGPRVDALFGRLVRFVLDADKDEPLVLQDPAVRAVVPALRELCGRAEGELELAWADRIAASHAPRDELALFPYFGNYQQLCRMEVGVLASALGGRARTLAFAGAGALPLSSLLFAGELGVAVDNLDRDAAALQAGARVAGALGYHHLGFQQVDVADADLSGYDVVVLAALAGSTPAAKRRILARLASSMAPGALLLARSARGLRTLLYPAIELDMLGGFELLTVVHPVNDVINSAVLLRARPDGG